MPLPVLSPEARAEALQKALRARRERADVLGALKSGEVTLAAVLQRTDDVVCKTPVQQLLRALPGIGTVRAQQLMSELNIPARRKVRGLGPRQRERLIRLFPAQG
ncbi:MAG TPA: integration host factor, actinobacterial type [Streptomyces sp.]|uniref:integration host factor, actinobacterial type n=1 Tax=Streptomyces sp. TaxID=1931 RepID=UPI002CD2A43A|nr:integration host factor, actinobacterial type [Streptomyces sp.]HWU09641.1 integration host factor, actinobacterial type [Streptomyces sp.]